jgi:hypothetical protein
MQFSRARVDSKTRRRRFAAFFGFAPTADRPRKMLGLAVSALDRDPRGYRATPERSMLLLDDGTHLAAGSVADAHEKDELNPSAPPLRPSRPGFTPPLRPVGGLQYDLTQFLTFRRMASMSPAQRRNPRAARSPENLPWPIFMPEIVHTGKIFARPSMTRAMMTDHRRPRADRGNSPVHNKANFLRRHLNSRTNNKPNFLSCETPVGLPNLLM